jgi:hypothetical protein
MFTKREFIEAYVISAIQGSGTERGGVDIYVLVLEASEAWDEIEKGEIAIPKRALSKAKSD